MKLFERLGRGPVVELVDLQQNRLMFQTRQKLALGKTARVQLGLREGPLRLKVRVHGVRPLASAGFLYTGDCETRIPRPDGPGPFESAGVRRPGRQKCRIRICSPRLPGFQAMSSDFSTTGIQIEAQAALPMDQVIPVSLHIEMAGFPVIEARARVAWCHQQSRVCWRVGLEFLDITPSAQAHLAKFHRLLAARDQLSGDNSCGRLWGSEDHVLGTNPRRLVDGHWTDA
ncbi:MAG: PilZ domain-containing protein [Armatimonadetes bacterium]|nr:PilZ domain-containing protein [Armatimonadota bacterium]